MKLLEGVVSLEDLRLRTETRKKLMNGFYAFNGKDEGYFVEKLEIEDKNKYKVIGSWIYSEN